MTALVEVIPMCNNWRCPLITRVLSLLGLSDIHHDSPFNVSRSTTSVVVRENQSCIVLKARKTDFLQGFAVGEKRPPYGTALTSEYSVDTWEFTAESR